MIAALEVTGLAVSRGDRRLFQDFDLQLAGGEAAALVGPNGAGKTSLLRAIAGFIRPHAGAIAFRGAAGPLEAEEARRAGVHLLGHQDGLKSGRTHGASCCSRCGGPVATPPAPWPRRRNSG